MPFRQMVESVAERRSVKACAPASVSALARVSAEQAVFNPMPITARQLKGIWKCLIH